MIPPADAKVSDGQAQANASSRRPRGRRLVHGAMGLALASAAFGGLALWPAWRAAASPFEAAAQAVTYVGLWWVQLHAARMPGRRRWSLACIGLLGLFQLLLLPGLSLLHALAASFMIALRLAEPWRSQLQPVAEPEELLRKLERAFMEKALRDGKASSAPRKTSP